MHEGCLASRMPSCGWPLALPMPCDMRAVVLARLSTDKGSLIKWIDSPRGVEIEPQQFAELMVSYR